MIIQDELATATVKSYLICFPFPWRSNYWYTEWIITKLIIIINYVFIIFLKSSTLISCQLSFHRIQNAISSFLIEMWIIEIRDHIFFSPDGT